VVRCAARLGFAVSLAGMLLGFLMTTPTADQEAAMDRGAAPAMVGAHSVGVADGGPSMPVTGWSSAGGDLRLPHFTGIHALQALPLLALLLAWLAARYPARLGAVRTRVRLVRVAAAAYAGLLALLTWQALRGQPLLKPESATLGAAGALVVLTAACAALAARRSAAAPYAVEPAVAGVTARG
jgi:hypothetical protein